MPATTSSAGISLTVLSVAVLGPTLGPYALIVFAALAGALWPLSAADTPSKVAGAWFMLRCTLTAVLLTASLASMIEMAWDYSAMEALAPVAFLIGALGNGWRPVFAAVGSALLALVGRAGKESK